MYLIDNLINKRENKIINDLLDNLQFNIAPVFIILSKLNLKINFWNKN